MRTFILTNQIIIVDSQAINWRFKIHIERLKIVKFKQFEQYFERKHQIYVVMYVDVTQTQQKTQFNLVLSKEIEEFRNLFNNEKIEILFDQKRNDHVIELLKSTKSFFMSFYNLSQSWRSFDNILTTLLRRVEFVIQYRQKRHLFYLFLFFNSYSIWHYILTHARFYSLQERLCLDVSFLSSSNFSFNLEFFLQRELDAFQAAYFFFFNFEIVTILNCFNNTMFIIIRIVDMMLFRVFKILIIFVVLISLLNCICKSCQFEHASNTCRIVMTSWSYEHVSEITSNTSRSFTSTKREISRDSPRSTSNMRTWGSQILLYDSRDQLVFARDKFRVTRVKILMLEINEINEVFSEL